MAPCAAESTTTGAALNRGAPADGAAVAVLPPSAHERRLLLLGQWAAAFALIGALLAPPLANVAALVLLLSFALLPSARRRLAAVMRTRLGRATGALLAVLAVAMLWADAPWQERVGAWWDWRPLLLLPVCLAIFDADARRRALLAFVAVASLGAAYSFWAWLGGYSTVGNNHGLPGIVLRNPVTQGVGFALACFLAAGLAAAERGLDRRLRALLALASAFLLANLVFVTSGRSGHVLLLVLLAVAALRHLGGWRRAAAVALLPAAVALAVFVSPMLQSRFGLLVDELRAPLASEQISAMGIRTVMWDVSWHMARERPLLGYGTGGFPAAYERALAKTAYRGWAATPTVDPHNQYLQVHLQAGLAGSVAFAWFLFAAFRHPGRPPHRVWASAVLLGWCVIGLATSVFTTFAESHMLMLALGMLLAGETAAGTDAAPTGPRAA